MLRSRPFASLTSIWGRRLDAALDAVRDGKSALPIVPGMVDDMAPEALSQLLGNEQSLALVALLDAEADALAGLKRDVLAKRTRRRARALEALAREVAGGSARR
jgi:hypothetical protein